MNDPDKIPVNIAEEREWLLAHKARTDMSWADLGRQSGLPAGTLSQFGPGTYKGDNERIAKDVMRFRQRLAQQAEINVEAPEIPEYYETATSRQIMATLSWAQRGRMIVGALGPGTGKTKALNHYRAAVSNVWPVTMAPSTAGVNNMQIEVLKVLGVPDAVGTPQKLSQRIRERVRDTGGLLAFDEAQHLSEKALDEIRGWYDTEGIGIALLGNEGVLTRLQGGARRMQFAQLYSRISMKLVRTVPLVEDVQAMAEAWGITDRREVDFLIAVGRKPGGLRGATMALELATMIAASERQPRGLNHMQDAWSQLSSMPVAA